VQEGRGRNFWGLIWFSLAPLALHILLNRAPNHLQSSKITNRPHHSRIPRPKPFNLAILRSPIALALLFFNLNYTFADTNNTTTTLWYDKPANPKNWEEALPVGSGRLGAMIFGDPQNERIQFNEDTLWTGKPHNYDRPGAGEALPEIRRLIFQGKIKDAENLARTKFLSYPVRQKAYQPFGDIHLQFPNGATVSNYRRELNLNTAIATTTYRAQGITYTEEVFASYPDNAIVIHLSADRSNSVNFTATMDSPHETSQTAVTDNNLLVLTGQVRDVVPPKDLGTRFESRLRILTTAGRVSASVNALTVQNANDATLLLVARTSFKNFQDVSGDPAAECQVDLAALQGKSYDQLRDAHIKDHQSLFNRVTLDLGTSKGITLPTDERIKRIIASKDGSALDADPALAALFFQYGRYMLISSSRPGTQPANLQGVWNQLLNPPWESKYTTNINVEMNYWPAEVANMSECTEPLFAMIHDLTISGGLTAKQLYNSRGWVLHHNTDIWRGTAPINNIDGVWPTGGAWLCSHLWEHYLFTGDKDFLSTTAYPLMKGAALFFVDSLVKDPTTGYLVTCPSFSPEQGTLCAGPAMDMQLIRALFDSTIEASKLLNTDQGFAQKLATVRSQLAPDKIGKYGQLQEWQQDVDTPNNNHRHMSPLWGVYPGTLFTPDNPKLFDAAKLLMKWRGDGSTGWSYAWRIPLWARVYDGNFAYHQLSLQLAKRTFTNLFDKCGPFQVDGNFGAAAGIAELLLQSQLHPKDKPDTWQIDLLPALPKAWLTGSVTGLCARGGFEVDMTWRDGALTSATIRSKLGNPCLVRNAGREVLLTTTAGATYQFDGQLHPAAHQQ
jgi:alpha-L-fucosidase 2